MKESSRYLTIGEVAKLFHLSNRTLRYYEEKGVLKPHYIGENGYRYYSPNQLLMLDMIRCFRQLDIPVEEMIKNLSREDADTKEQVIELLMKQEMQIEQRIQEERKRQEYLRQITQEFRSLEMCTDGEIRIIDLPSCCKVKFYIDSIDSEDEREIYFREVLSFISGKLGEDYPMLYGVVPTVEAKEGRYNYAYIEFESRKPLNILSQQKLYVMKKEVHVCYEEIPSETCLTLSYDAIWESMPQFYEKMFRYVEEHNIKLDKKVREKWVMPRTEENGEIRIWGSLEFPIKS